MIDLGREETITLAQAAKLLPRRRGKKVHASTLWRWAKYGVRGRKLDALLTPSGYLTSVEAVARFFASLADLEAGKPVAVEQKAPPQRSWADDVLAEFGVTPCGG